MYMFIPGNHKELALAIGDALHKGGSHERNFDAIKACFTKSEDPLITAAVVSILVPGWNLSLPAAYLRHKSIAAGKGDIHVSSDADVLPINHKYKGLYESEDLKQALRWFNSEQLLTAIVFTSLKENTAANRIIFEEVLERMYAKNKADIFKSNLCSEVSLPVPLESVTLTGQVKWPDPVPCPDETYQPQPTKGNTMATPAEMTIFRKMAKKEEVSDDLSCLTTNISSSVDKHVKLLQAEAEEKRAREEALVIIKLSERTEAFKDAMIETLRAIRVSEKKAKVNLDDLIRARDYAAETGNFLPLLGVVEGTTCMLKDDERKVPEGWTKKA